MDIGISRIEPQPFGIIEHASFRRQDAVMHENEIKEFLYTVSGYEMEKEADHMVFDSKA